MQTWRSERWSSRSHRAGRARRAGAGTSVPQPEADRGRAGEGRGRDEVPPQGLCSRVAGEGVFSGAGETLVKTLATATGLVPPTAGPPCRHRVRCAPVRGKAMNKHTCGLILLTLVVLPLVPLPGAQKDVGDSADRKQPAGKDVFGLTKVWQFHLELTAKDYDRMQPAGKRSPGAPGPAKAGDKPGEKPADVHRGSGFEIGRAHV